LTRRAAAAHAISSLPLLALRPVALRRGASTSRELLRAIGSSQAKSGVNHGSTTIQRSYHATPNRSSRWTTHIEISVRPVTPLGAVHRVDSGAGLPNGSRGPPVVPVENFPAVATH